MVAGGISGLLADRLCQRLLTTFSPLPITSWHSPPGKQATRLTPLRAVVRTLSSCLALACLKVLGIPPRWFGGPIGEGWVGGNL